MWIILSKIVFYAIGRQLVSLPPFNPLREQFTYCCYFTLEPISGLKGSVLVDGPPALLRG